MGDEPASVVERANRLVKSIGAWLPHAIDPHAVTTEELALAGVARCRRLLVGMVKLHDDPDLAGVLARTLFETWLSSTFLVLAEDDAYERLESTDISLHRKLASRMLALPPDGSERNERMREGAQAALDGPEAGMGEFKVYDMALAVAKLLKSANDPNAHYPTTMYTVSYGVESYVSTHGGLGAIKQHMIRNGAIGDEIFAGPWHHSAHDHRLDLMSAAVLTLANRVGQLLALDTSGLEAIAGDWFGGGPGPAS
jgi:hypothetical protein